MIRSLCTLILASCFLFHPTLQAQPASGDNLNFESVDSLLAKRDYARARARILIIQPVTVDLSRPSEFTSAIIQDYFETLNRLRSIPDLPDSITKQLAENVSAFNERFSELNAGARANRFYGEYLGLLEESRYSAAYERFSLADFFRHLYVTRERERLFSNFNLAKEFVKAHKFTEADTMIKGFATEKKTSVLVHMKDTLAQKYDALADQLHLDQVTVAYESGRQRISPTAYLDIGLGLIPSVKVAYANMRFGNPITTELVQVTADGDAFTFSTIGLNAEAGLFITPSLAAGISYFRSTTLQENALVSHGVGIRFKATFTYQMIDIFIKYIFDERAGQRPYVSVMGGYVKGRLIPESYSNDPLSLILAEVEEGGAQLGAEFGTDFVFSPEFPLCLTLFLTGRVNRTDGEVIVKGSQFLIGCKLGYLF